MTKRQVTRLVKEWQKTLHLVDWQIILEFKTIEQLPEQLALVAITSERKVARIFLRWPHKDNHGQEDNVEATIIHELLHCHFDALLPVNIEKKKHQMILLEQAIDLVASACYTLKHNKECR